MTDQNSNDLNNQEPKALDRSELDALEHSTEKFIRQRLIFWAIRWAIGFTLIAIIVWHYPQYKWLWFVGGAVALFSLSMILFARFALSGKISETNKKADQLEASLRDLEDGK